MAKDGKDLERIVHLIESSISPDARVEWDVQMPVLGSTSGKTRQCDVVIWSGSKPRETITIVEVQDRNSQVEIGMFGGWLHKMEQVGAQQLICVSRHDFPSSIKEEAFKRGNTVGLVTFKESTPESIPLESFSIRFRYSQFDLPKVHSIRVGIDTKLELPTGVKKEVFKERTFNPNDLLWTFDRKRLISLYILCREYYSAPKGSTRGEGCISFSLKDEKPLYYLYKDIFIPVQLDCEFSWALEEIEKPFSILSYEQDEHGVLAWIAEAIHETPKGHVIMRVPIVKSGEKYVARNLYTEAPFKAEVTLSAIKR